MSSAHTHVLTAIDVLTLLINIYEGSEDKNVGMEDANNSLLDLFNKLSFNVRVDRDILESALWSCNMMNEKKAFRHPLGMNFDVFLKKILGKKGFNPTYHFIEDENNG